MKNFFKIYNLNADLYDCMVICLTCESIFSYIDALQKAISNNGIKDGTILIDQLLISGNGENRFLTIRYSNGSFDYTSAQNVEADIKYREITSYELKNNELLLENSILSNSQITLIKKGRVI